MSQTMRVLLSGLGMAATSYALLSVNMLVHMFTFSLSQAARDAASAGDAESADRLSEDVNAAIHRLSYAGSVAMLGTVLGQLVFGFLADSHTRARSSNGAAGQAGCAVNVRAILSMCTMGLIAAACLACALVPAATHGGVDVSVRVCMCMFVLGLGVGGEYPVGAALSSAAAPNASSDRVAARSGASLAFAWQGVGSLLAAAVAWAALAGRAGDGQGKEDADGVLLAARTCLAFGALIPVLILYPRYALLRHAHAATDTDTDTQAPADGQQAGAVAVAQGVDVSSSALAAAPSGDGEDADERDALMTHTHAAAHAHTHACIEEGTEAAPEGDTVAAEAPPRAGRPMGASLLYTLAGTAGSWFLLDVVFYANGMFAASVLRAAGIVDTAAQPVAVLVSEARGSFVVAAMAFPGYLLGAALVPRLGGRFMQMWGFVAMAALYAALFFTAPRLHDSQLLFFALYGLTFTVANAGPNTTTYVIPTEVFPEHAKARCHGASAACGKLGAAFGAAVMPALLTSTASASTSDTHGLQTAMLVCATVCGIGAVWTQHFTRPHAVTATTQASDERRSE